MSNDTKQKIEVRLDFHRAHIQNGERETNSDKKNFFESMADDCRDEILSLFDELIQENEKFKIDIDSLNSALKSVNTINDELIQERDELKKKAGDTKESDIVRFEDELLVQALDKWNNES